tara:strand:+ start:227 stop:475 length:249 start_codon:yes stop_codon:yes gene_type:complete
MNKNEKSFKSITPGHSPGVRVVKSKRFPKGDLTHALQQWKKSLKDSNKLQTLKDRKEYIKPSVTKRKQMDRAKYLESLRDND